VDSRHADLLAEGYMTRPASTGFLPLRHTRPQSKRGYAPTIGAN
jgi:hypothetical protein